MYRALPTPGLFHYSRRSPEIMCPFILTYARFRLLPRRVECLLDERGIEILEEFNEKFGVSACLGDRAQFSAQIVIVRELSSV